MNKKGLTLVELIAVIVIIALLAVIIYPQVAKNLSIIKSDTKTIQESTVKEAAVQYLSDNVDKEEIFLNDKLTITLKELVDEGYIVGSLKNAKTSKEYDLNSSNVVIERTGSFPNYNYNYTVYLYDK